MIGLVVGLVLSFGVGGVGAMILAVIVYLFISQDLASVCCFLISLAYSITLTSYSLPLFCYSLI